MAAAEQASLLQASSGQPGSEQRLHPAQPPFVDVKRAGGRRKHQDRLRWDGRQGGNEGGCQLWRWLVRQATAITGPCCPQPAS